MSESAIFFETNGTGDGAADYTQAQLAAWLRRTFSPTPASEGVLKGYGGELAVSGTSSPLSVAAGAAMVYGFPYESTGVVSPTVSTPSIGTTGFRVVLRVDWAAQTVRIAVKVSSDGVASAPAVTQVANTTWEISLATGTITTGGVIALTDARTYCHFTTMVSTAMLEALAVTSAKIAANAVIAGKIATGGVSATAQLADSIVTAAKIANRTRKFLVPAAIVYNNTDSAQVVLGSTPELGYAMPDNKQSVAFAAFRLPEDWVSDLTIKVVTVPNIAGSANLYGQLSVYYVGASEGTTNTAASVSGSGSFNETHTLTPSELVAGTNVGLAFTREGANVLDTVGNYVQFVGFLISYTADS